AYTQYQFFDSGNDPVFDPAGQSAPASGARTPAQIRKSYGVDSLTFNGIVGDGTGQTIAIVDAFDDPSFVSDNSANYGISDLVRFDNFFGLPHPPSFKKLNQSGVNGSYPAFNASWSGEIALDVEWAHAMAPGASIILVEANSNGSNDLNAAVNTAKALAGVTAVSMSYGGSEFSNESLLDPTFVRSGVSFFSSSGDTGGVVTYQSSSVNVVGVGGTSLTQADSTGTYFSESGWGGSGGGVSAFESKPGYQTIITTPGTRRGAPDVSAVADPATGVAVLNSSSGGIGSANPWETSRIGGTSLSAPLWAGFMSLVNQARSAIGLGSLSGNTQTLPRLYTLSSSDFHDVTSGSAGGNSSGPGYDLVTGRGTPKPQLYADVAGGATISGTVFQDFNGNATLDGGESAQSGVTVYLDLNGNGGLDSTIEPFTSTNASGIYSFSDLVGGRNFPIREVMPSGFVGTSGALSATTTYNTTVNGKDIGNFPISFSGGAFTLRMDAGGTQDQVFTSATATGSPAFSIAKSLLASLTFTGTAGSDAFNLDLSNGNPLPTGGITYNGTGNDSLVVTGSALADTVGLSSTLAVVGGRNVAYSGVTSISLSLGDGADIANINSLPSSLQLTIDAGNDQDTINLAETGTAPAVVIAPSSGNDLLNVNTDNTGNARAVLNANQTLGGLNVGTGGSVDLTNVALVIEYTSDPIDTIQSLLVSGYASGAWNGDGIRSSTAASTPGTTVGLAEATDLFSAFPAIFSGQTIDSSALLLRYTLNGDANLDRTVDATDLGLLSMNWGQSARRFSQGDFNYSSTVDVDDLNLLNLNWQQSLILPTLSPAVAKRQFAGSRIIEDILS
ncbi:MAG TPA: SdrD B-like domain-containing protein, partial [Tepidisphaeraceae bacterium]